MEFFADLFTASFVLLLFYFRYLHILYINPVKIISEKDFFPPILQPVSQFLDAFSLVASKIQTLH